MVMHMDNMMSASSSRERAQRLYEKNIELESKRRRSAQARVPSDPNIWQQMRENYEEIILEDHAFSEQNSVEYALWQLHYRRIEELRAHFSAAVASTNSNMPQGVKGPGRPERVAKIRMQFKTFLSEATGFYHDLIVKIRVKYGLPLDHFSEDSGDNVVLDKDGKKSAEMKKGLVSCHRCLIYLGDLARYKGLYGEGDSKSREYAAASSYYLQAASICPSSGNPHHQLAIIASYSGDELVAVYRYFRSLAVESPFSTARDNLIVAFEKNRQNFSQLPGNVKDSVTQMASKGSKKGEGKPLAKDTNGESSPVKESLSVIETCKLFRTRFVRLNGILFTRTSLETFGDVLALLSSNLRELLSSGLKEKLTFGTDAAENALLVVRLVAVLVFTVYNLKKEGEGQTYAEIVQRAALLQNAFTALFELMGLIVDRCSQLEDVSSSSLLPGILVFMEWLACYPDVAAGSSDMDEKQSKTRSCFWKCAISFLNKILSAGSLYTVDDDEDDSCFSNMSRYDEGETENGLALWEDFELRGFLPLTPAQSILDFSRKSTIGSDGIKERKARIKRILAAGKVLAGGIRIDNESISFNSKKKKFVVGVEAAEDDIHTSSGPPKMNGWMQDMSVQTMASDAHAIVQSNPLMREHVVEYDDDDEVIVFKPPVIEKKPNIVNPVTVVNGVAFPDQAGSEVELKNCDGYISAALDNLHQLAAADAASSFGNSHTYVPNVAHAHFPNWLMEEASIANSLKGLKPFENGHVATEIRGGVPTFPQYAVPSHQPVRMPTFSNYSKAPERVISPRIEAISTSGTSGNCVSPRSSTMPLGVRKSPVSRPVRHLGPPPGFNHVPPRSLDETVSAELNAPIMDDYSWLDGYQLPPSLNRSGIDSLINGMTDGNQQSVSNITTGSAGLVNFPFPGKQAPVVQHKLENEKGWQDYQVIEQLKIQEERRLQQQLMNGNHQSTLMADSYQGHGAWNGRYLV